MLFFFVRTHSIPFKPLYRTCSRFYYSLHPDCNTWGLLVNLGFVVTHHEESDLCSPLVWTHWLWPGILSTLLLRRIVQTADNPR